MPLFRGRGKRGLGAKEQDSLHVVEFSQGKPNELSFNVLEGMASQQDSPKRGGLGRRFGKGRTNATEDMAESAITGALTREDIPLTASSEKSRSTRKNKAVKRKQAKAAEPDKADRKKRRSKGQTYKSVSSRSKHGTADSGQVSSRVMGESSQQEVERRRARRKRARTVSITLAAIIAAGLIGIGGWQAFLYISDQMDNVNLLHRACEEVAESDETLVALDEFFSQPLGEDAVQTAESLKKQIPEARRKLETARGHAERSMENLNDVTRDKETSEALIKSIDAREKLYDVAEQKLDEDIMAKQAADLLDDAWSKIQQANSLLSEQAMIIEDTTNENVDISTKYLTEAQEIYEDVKTKLEETAEAYEGINLDAANRYVDKRLEAIEYGLTSNTAILIQDRKTAESNNERYNKADREGVELAKELPDSFNQPVVDLYTRRTAEMDEEYNAARTEIASYDSTIRDYLDVIEAQMGQESKS